MTYTGPCFSPSRGGTQDAQRCMRLFDYKRRWHDPRGWSADIAMGNIIHAGLSAYYLARNGSLRTQILSDENEAISAALENEWTGEGQEEAYRLAKECVGEAISLNVLGKTGRVLAVEQEMGPEKCHPDLVIQHTDKIPLKNPDVYAEKNWLEVVDWKLSYRLNPEHVAKRLQSYETSWQLKHYAWRVKQEFHLPCLKVTVVQMAATPKVIAREQGFKITQESLDAWEASARQWWHSMESGPYPQNYDGCLKYGEKYPCPFYCGCHSLHSDESKFHTLYKRKG